jgi:2-dehydro-3-deoxyphosphooctonate aldolase (KDO 8-P synthase)
MDSVELYLEVGKKLYSLMKNRKDEWYYKASFSKENRTSIHGKRGVGLERAIEAFKQIKEECPGIRLTTDFHEPKQAEELVGLIDVAQIPAFLGRQTDLVVECAKCYEIVNIKKMQHLGPDNVIKSIDKIKDTNSDTQAWITERGTSLGYDHLIVDFTIVDELKRHYDKVIFDVTHSTQRSRKIHIVQGDPVLAKRYFRIAETMNYDGVFAETHPRPNESASDGDCMIPLQQMEGLLNV